MYHNIVLYPFDTDELDEEEVRLNERIRVSILYTRLNESASHLKL